MSNRDAIAATAIRLFNAQGTKAVSTNHIAQAAGISPGNLYYHFRDKEAIIREVWSRMTAEWDVVWRSEASHHTLDDLVQIVRRNFVLEWRYRFFYREVRSILQRDPAFAVDVQAHTRSRLKEQAVFFAEFGRQGVLQHLDTATMHDLLTASWVVANHWIGHLEVTGESVDPSQLLRGERIVLHLVAPYLTDVARAELPSLLEDEEPGRRAYAEALVASDPTGGTP